LPGSLAAAMSAAWTRVCWSAGSIASNPTEEAAARSLLQERNDRHLRNRHLHNRHLRNCFIHTDLLIDDVLADGLCPIDEAGIDPACLEAHRLRKHGTD